MGFSVVSEHSTGCKRGRRRRAGFLSPGGVAIHGRAVDTRQRQATHRSLTRLDDYDRAVGYWQAFLAGMTCAFTGQTGRGRNRRDDILGVSRDAVLVQI